MPDGEDLASLTCEPCRGGAPPVADTERDRLMAQLPEWRVLDGTRIERRVVCKAFAGALALVNRIGALAETAGHHPDLTFGWGYVTVSLQTKAIEGLHRNDFVLAAKIDKLLRLGIHGV